MRMPVFVYFHVTMRVYCIRAYDSQPFFHLHRVNWSACYIWYNSSWTTLFIMYFDCCSTPSAGELTVADDSAGRLQSNGAVAGLFAQLYCSIIILLDGIVMNDGYANWKRRFGKQIMLDSNFEWWCTECMDTTSWCDGDFLYFKLTCIDLEYWMTAYVLNY